MRDVAAIRQACRPAVIVMALCFGSTAVLEADYKESFKRAIYESNQKNWQAAISFFREAITEEASETGQRIVISGMDFKPYLPQFYLGVALMRSEDCGGAVTAWKTSESQGTVKRSREYTLLRRFLTDCLSRLARAAAAVAPPPTFTAAPTSVQIQLPASSGNGSLVVTVTTQPTCTLTAGANGALASVAPGTGTCNGSVTVTVTANGAQDSGTVTVAGQTVTVTQNPTCIYAVSPAVVQMGARGGSVTMTVTTQPSCSWAAGSNHAFLSMTPGDGISSGTATVMVAPNTGEQRVGTVTVAGQTVTVTQAASGRSN